MAIHGVGFSRATAVLFNGIAAQYQIVSDQEISARVPIGAHSGPVVVTYAGGSASGPSFFLAPTLRSYQPTAARVGEAVLVRGWNLQGVTRALVSDIPASFTVSTDSTMLLIVPRNARTGSISLEHPNGMAQSSSPLLIPPTVLAFQPGYGDPGVSVDVMGYTFDDVRSVEFHGVPAVYQVLSDSVIRASVPLGATTGPVTVATSSGSTAGTRDFVVGSGSELVVTYFSPDAGRIGSEVVLEGLNFEDVTSVEFSGVGASFQVQTPERVVATVPRGATSGPITVSGARGTSATTRHFLVRATIASMTPTRGQVQTPVVLKGSGFTGTTGVRFDGSAAMFTAIADTILSTRVPIGATTGLVVVEKPGTTDTAEVFVVLPNASPAALELRAPWPNPSRTGATVPFELVAPARATLTIYTMAGARIRREAFDLPAGSHERSWNLEDERGQRVRPGIYVIELRVGSLARSRRIVVL